MTTREQLLQGIEQVPDFLLDDILEFVRTIQVEKQTKEGNARIQNLQERGRAFASYLESEEKWLEVYRRLAQS